MGSCADRAAQRQDAAFALVVGSEHDDHVLIVTVSWGPGKLDQQHYVRIYMAGLRRKLESDPAQPQYLLTEIGIG